ncbi:MAG: DUF115 domain-containing protein, partial [Nitrospirae bacterium]
RDLFGNPVKTNPTFLNYKAIFEKKIAEFSNLVINATEGGLPLEGAQHRRLAEVLADFRHTVSINVAARLAAIRNRPNEPDWDGLCQEIHLRMRDVYRIERTANHVCRLLNRMAAKRHMARAIDTEFVRLGKTVERLTSLIPRYQTARSLLHWMDIEIEQQLSADTKALDHIQDPFLKHDKQIERGLRYYGGLSRTAPLLREKMARLLRRLRSWHDTRLLERSAATSLNMLAIAERYTRLELYDHAMRWLARYFQEQRPQEAPCLQGMRLSLHLSLARRQLTQAMQWAHMAQRMFPEQAEIQHLCAQIQEEWVQWQQRRLMILSQAGEDWSAGLHPQKDRRGSSQLVCSRESDNDMRQAESNALRASA